MWRPDTAACSMTRSQSGWRPTSVTGLASSCSETTLSSRLTTTRATIFASRLLEGAPGAETGGAQQVADRAHAADGERGLVGGFDFLLVVGHPRERDDAVVALDRDRGRGGARL